MTSELSRSNEQLKAEIAERERVAAELRESEERFRVLSESSLTGIYLIQENRFRYVNPAMARMFGYTVEEMVDRLAPADLVYPDDRGIVAEHIRRRVDGEVEESRYGFRGLRKDGSVFFVEVHGRRVQHGGKIAVIGTLVDNTERKRAGEEHQAYLWFLESMDRINRAMQGSGDVERMLSGVLGTVLSIFACDRAWLVYPCDSEAASWRVPMEHTRPEFPGAFALALDLPVTPEIATVFRAVRASSGPVRFDPGSACPLPPDVARRFSIQSMIAMAIYPRGDRPYMLGLHQCSYPRVWTPQEERLLQEIGRRLADALTSLLMFRSLRDSERRLEDAQRIAHVGYWDRDLVAGRITLSDEGARIFGLQPEERVVDLRVWHERWQTLIHPEDRPRAAAAAAAALGGGPRYDLEYRVVHRTGEVRIVHSQGDVIRDESGRPCRMFGIMQDITERKRAEAELRESEERFRTLVHFSFDVYWETDAQHRFTRQEFAERLADAPAPGSEIGKARWEVPYLEPDEDAWRKHRATLDAHLPFRDFELARPAPDGGKRYVSVSGLPVFDSTGRFVGYRGVGRHITERKRVEAELRARQELLDLAQKAARAVAFDWYIGARESENRWSPELEAMYGLQPGTFDGTYQGWKKLVHPDDWPAVKVAINRAHESGDVAAEYRVIHKDGTVHWLRAKGRMFFDAKGQPERMVGFMIDVTDWRDAEEALRASEARFRTFVDRATDAFFLLDEHLNVVDVNRQACESLGYSREELVGMHPRDFDAGLDEPAIAGLAERAGAGQGIAFETRHRRKDGTVFPVEIRTGTFEQSGRRFYLALARDISERKRAEEALRQSEAYLTEAQRLSHTGSWAFDVAGNKYVYLSGECFRIFEFDAQEGLPNRDAVSRLIHPEDWDRVNADFQMSLREKVDISSEFRIVLPSGTVKHVHATRHPVLNDPGDVVKVVGTVIDITDRKRGEEALRRSEAYLAEGQRLSHTGSWAWNPLSEQCFYWSEEMFRIFDIDPQQGLPTREIFWARIHPEDRESMRELLGKSALEKTEYVHDHRILLPDGTVKHIHAIGHPVLDETGELVECIGTAIDVTERKRGEEERERLRQLEADLAHIQRVSLMGELAASIAHEVNQPLAGIVSNGSACLRWLAGDVPNLEEAREAARRIVRDGKRAGEVIARVRALTRRAATPMEKLDLNQSIQEVVALVGDEANRRRAVIRTQCGDALAPVAGDRVQLQQVVLNLVMNAIEAMSSVGERAREVVITTRDVDAEHVQVTVEDSGAGLDPNAMEKIFDPFYTTKVSGMGMGLSICRSIVHNHGGRLWATAKDGPGTMFHFTLPKYAEEEPHAGVREV